MSLGSPVAAGSKARQRFAGRGRRNEPTLRHGGSSPSPDRPRNRPANEGPSAPAWHDTAPAAARRRPEGSAPVRTKPAPPQALPSATAAGRARAPSQDTPPPAAGSVRTRDDPSGTGDRWRLTNSRR